MITDKKIMTVLLFLIVLGYVYKLNSTEKPTYSMPFVSNNNIFKTLQSMIISSQKDNKTFWNITNDFLNGTQLSRIEALSKDSSGNVGPMNVLAGGNGIIFLESTNRMEPPSLVLCAIESAARVYKDRPVVFFMKGLNETNSDAAKKKYFPAFISYNNVYIFPLRMEEVFAETPLLSWYQKVDPSREKYWTHVSSDGCRLALIWKYGGIYMDSDIISMHQIPRQHFVAAEASQVSGNSAFGLSPRHYFAWKCMDDFAHNFKGEIWGYQGPTLLTRTLKTFCNLSSFTAVEDITCANITFLHPQRFYPFPYPEWKRYFEVWDKEPTFEQSYALHLWNYMNSGEHKTMVPGSNTLVEHLYQKYCPTTYGDFSKMKTNP